MEWNKSKWSLKKTVISEMLLSRWLWSDDLDFLRCSLMFVWMKMEVHVEKTKLLYNYMIVNNERICEGHIHSWYITVFSGCNMIKLGKSQCQTRFPTFLVVLTKQNNLYLWPIIIDCKQYVTIVTAINKDFFFFLLSESQRNQGV